MIEANPIPKITRIIFWEPSVSPHKADFFAAMAKISPNIEVICCAQSQLSEDRKVQGWTIKYTESFRTIIAPSKNEIDQLVHEQVGSSLHIFSGIRWVPSIVAGLKSVRMHKAKFAIMSEPRVAEGWKGKLRFLQSWLTEGWLRRNAAFVLAQGRNGPPWFTSVGYSADCVFPFAYFIDPPSAILNEAQSTSLPNRPIQIGYVGRLVEMKGIFDLVAAVGKLGNTAHLKIAGTGPQEGELQTRCNDLHINAEFLGVLPMIEVCNFMQKLDLLVLASTEKDGWGVVVSEALMSGTAVIATPCVGASLVLDGRFFGECVPAESPDAIAQAIRKLKDIGAFSPELRKQRAKLAQKFLSADGGARHLLAIIQWKFAEAERPAPFYETKVIQ